MSDVPSAPRRRDRRRFLQGAAAVGLGSVAMTSGLGAAGRPRVQKYVPLGKTGLEVSDIGFGSGGCKTPELVRYCYEAGINYFDTAEMYRTRFTGGEHVESLIGEALHDVRQKVVITSKMETEGDESVDVLMTRLEAALRRLRTDYIDVFLNHAVNDVARLEHAEWWEFVARAKQQGKIRFTGLSGHGGMLRACLDHALEHDLVEVVLVAYNFGSDPAFYEGFTKHFDLIANQEGLPERLERAHAKGVGVIAMKTLMGAKLNDLASYRWGGATMAQAAFRWVLSNPHVDSLVVSMKQPALVDEYLRASGQRGVGPEQARALRDFIAHQSGDYCRPACSACEQACPKGVPIADVLRQRMYARRYDEMEMARSGYARLAGGASPCLSCDGAPCASACPWSLPISELTRDTAGLLG